MTPTPTRGPNDDDLLRLATLVNRPELRAAELTAHKREMGALNREQAALVMLAAKLLAGEPYRVDTDSADTLQRWRSFAERMGATVVAQGSSPAGRGRMAVVFGPPPRQ